MQHNNQDILLQKPVNMMLENCCSTVEDLTEETLFEGPSEPITTEMNTKANDRMSLRNAAGPSGITAKVTKITLA